MSSLSSSIRVDGLEGLMELIKGEESSSILEEHLSLLMNKIAPMVTDRERKIRKLANTIFSTILKQVEKHAIEKNYKRSTYLALVKSAKHFSTFLYLDISVKYFLACSIAKMKLKMKPEMAHF